MKPVLPALLITLTMLLSACGGGGPSGTYAIDVDATLKSMGQDDPRVSQLAETMKSMKLEMSFNGDGTFRGDSKMTILGMTREDSISGTWTLDGDKLSMTGKNKAGKEDKRTATFKDGQILVNMKRKDDPVLVLTKK